MIARVSSYQSPKCVPSKVPDELDRHAGHATAVKRQMAARDCATQLGCTTIDVFWAKPTT
jgi:hypothetical protein